MISRFKVGDLVRVREWDDMKEEFGSEGDFKICCECSFVDMMMSTCGDVCTIKEVTASGLYRLSGENEDGWIYSDDMIFPAITYREYAEKFEPKRIKSFHWGGVEGCPFSLSGICQSKPDFCEAPSYSDEVCGRCWDRYLTEKEYKEYEKRKKEKENMKFKDGDFVRVVKAVDGDGAIWVSSMDKFIGKIYKIKQADSDKTCKLEGIDLFWFPFEALEPASLKDILTPFCTVELRNGSVYLFDGKNRFLRERGYMDVDNYNENLNHQRSSEYDVVDICEPCINCRNIPELLSERNECIWKREEIVEITAEEAARKLKDQYGGKEVKIVV